MKPMYRIIPILLLFLLIGAIGFGVWKAKEAVETKKQLDEYEYSSKDARKENEELRGDNRKLQAQNRQLEDSIQVLNAEIQALKKELREKVTEIRANRKLIQQLKEESNRLLTQINSLKQQKNVDMAKIKRLEDDRFALDVKLGDLFLQNDSLENVNSTLLEDLVIKETAKDDIINSDTTSTPTAVLTNTGKIMETTGSSKEEAIDPPKMLPFSSEKIGVTFSSLIPITKSNKASKNARKWNGTLIDFRINYDGEDVSRLFGKNFVVQIKDKKTGEILSPRESGGSGDTKGLTFSFLQNPVSVTYVNYQKKTSDEFAVYVYYKDENGELVNIPTGMKDVKFGE